MKNIVKFNIKNLIVAILFFLTEVLIATKLKNIFFIRAYFGDVLVVMLIYYFIRAFIKINPIKLITGIFIFSCVIEGLQYLNFAERLGFQDNPIMMTVLGNSFSWLDIACYAAGCTILMLISGLDRDKNHGSRSNKSN